MPEKGCSGFVRHLMDVNSIFLLVWPKNLLGEAVFASNYLKLSLPMFRKYFSIIT